MKKLILYTLVAKSLLFSQDQLFIGTRPLGMGGAFIAVADDANTIPGIQLAFPDCEEKSLPLAMQIFTHGNYTFIYRNCMAFGDRIAMVLTGLMLGLTIRN